MGRDYRLALGGAKIALCLLRAKLQANRDRHVMRTFVIRTLEIPARDRHVMRTFEIPACGAFMLAERTDEHLELFEENREAAYFGSVEELLDKVRYYLSHEDERQRIAKAGYRRVTAGRHTYLDRLKEILDQVKSLAGMV